MKFSLRHLTALLTLITQLLFLLMVFYILKEAWPFLHQTSLFSFLKSAEWRPVHEPPLYHIGHFIKASIYVSLLASAIASPIALALAVFIVFFSKGWLSSLLLSCIELLAGIPSVVYGFYGMQVLLPRIATFFNMTTGESILAASMLLAMMALPFITRSLVEAMNTLKANHLNDSLALGISKEYFIRNIVLTRIVWSLMTGILLAFTRTIGETMAVMLVIGNSPIAPKLLSRGQTISSLIALEMGMAEVGSEHYSALFAAGFVLLVIVCLLNFILIQIQKKVNRIEFHS